MTGFLIDEVTHMTVEKVAVIVAGGSGMGAAAAEKLASEGFRVAILSSSGKGEALANRLGSALPVPISQWTICSNWLMPH
jgi:NAD(P)-dependent dehydrogenase (short-subunit alcohol dehydrogenase family)